MIWNKPLKMFLIGAVSFSIVTTFAGVVFALSGDQLRELNDLESQAADALNENKRTRPYEVQSTPSAVEIPETDLQVQRDRAVDSLKEQERRAFERDFRDFVGDRQ